MKYLSEEELEAFPTKKNGRGGESKNKATLDVLKGLEIGQHVLLKRTEWIGKSDPAAILSSKTVVAEMGGRFHVLGLIDDSGWIITRRVPKP